MATKKPKPAAVPTPPAATCPVPPRTAACEHEPLEFECLHRPHGILFNDLTLPLQSGNDGEVAKPVHIRICKHCKVLYAEF